jgi:hypothetical protein
MRHAVTISLITGVDGRLAKFLRITRLIIRRVQGHRKKIETPQRLE